MSNELTNADMIANRFGRWHARRQKIKAIVDHLNASKNNSVLLVGAYKAHEYTQKHVSMFKATKNGAYVQRGKNWDCIDFAVVRFGSYVAK